MVFKSSTPLAIISFVDTDWRACPNDRRLKSKVCVFFGANPVFWSSRKQIVMAQSKIEAKYQVLTCRAIWILWLKALLREMLISYPIIYVI